MAVYACSDLHGYLILYKKIKQFLKEDDIVYFLGDANDRGPEGWALIQAIYNDKQFRYISGNHEEMFAAAGRSWLESGLSPDDFCEFHTRPFRLIEKNGGVKTLTDWIRDGANKEWLSKMEALPHYMVYTNKDNKKILLSHAGCTLYNDSADNDSKLLIFDDLLYGREHIHDIWSDECPDNWIIIHGHTPIPSLKERLHVGSRRNIGAFWYANNHKCCIDQRTFTSEVACLLDLDTFETHLFTVMDM